MSSLVSLFLRFFILLSLLGLALESAASVAPMVTAGGSHTVALKADGTVVAWGSNYNGELGDGTTTDRLSPVTVTGLT